MYMLKKFLFSALIAVFIVTGLTGCKEEKCKFKQVAEDNNLITQNIYGYTASGYAFIYTKTGDYFGINTTNVNWRMLVNHEAEFIATMKSNTNKWELLEKDQYEYHFRNLEDSNIYRVISYNADGYAEAYTYRHPGNEFLIDEFLDNCDELLKSISKK